MAKIRKLRRALRFNRKDLQLNQDGKLSRRQIRKLRRQRVETTNAAYVFGALLMVVGVVMYSQNYAATIVFIGAGLFVAYGEFRLGRIPLEHLAVQHVEGRAKKIHELDEDGEHDYTIIVGEQEFKPDFRRFRAFREQTPYRIHFVAFEAEDGLPVDVPVVMVSAELLTDSA